MHVHVKFSGKFHRCHCTNYHVKREEGLELFPPEKGGGLIRERGGGGGVFNGGCSVTRV